MVTVTHPEVSVVIPTFNRSDSIAQTLQHLASQTLSSDRFEVLVVDDGSTDDTEEIVGNLEYPFRFTFLRQLNLGAAAARNRGANAAEGTLLVFLDSDIITDTGFLEAHLKCHTTPGAVIVGRMLPWPGMEREWYEQVIDPESAGRDYGPVDRSIQFDMVYSCNLSITKDSFLQLNGFDESFPGAGFEDTEFAYRALKSGCSILYQPAAIGYHNHSLRLEQRLQKERAYKRSVVILLQKHPESRTAIHGVDELVPLSWTPLNARIALQRIKARALSFPLLRISMQHMLVALGRWKKCPRLASFLFWRLMTSYSYVGFRDGMKSYSPSGQLTQS